MKSECIDGHKYENISYKSFIECCVTKIWYSEKACKICDIKINEFKDNYICKTCGYIFCDLCIDSHCKYNNHNNKIKYVNYNSICKFHNKEYKFYCNKCNSNLCNKCKKTHKAHSYKSYKKLLKFIKNEIDYLNFTLNENRKKIKKVIKWSHNYHLIEYLNFLDNINIYLQNFNFEFFHFYHFQNFKYFYEFVTKQIDDINYLENYFNNVEYVEFLHFNYYNKSFKNKILQNKKYLLYDINIDNNNTFVYYDNNLLFFFCRRMGSFYLKIFEIKNYCLRFILLKYFGKNKISLFRRMQKLHEYIFVSNYKIMIFKYNENKKSLTLKDHFFIDLNPLREILHLKNGDIAIVTYFDLKIIKHKKVIKSFDGQYDNLYQPNDLIFISGRNSEITFFDSVKYQIIKKIKLFPSIVIENFRDNDKFIMTMDENNKYIYIIDIKYLEIIKVIENQETSNKLFYTLNNNNDYYIISKYHINKYNFFKENAIDSLNFDIDFWMG